MKRVVMFLCTALLLLHVTRASAKAEQVWRIVTEDGRYLTDIAEEPGVGDEYLTAENRLYEIVGLQGEWAIAADRGDMELPDVSWLDADAALPVAAMTRRIALYCTHSDESYEPTDGFYSTNDRGSIYEVAQALADSLAERGAEAVVSPNLHHPHDAGAYRRSRQTAVQLLKETMPDCLLDIHRDGIPDPDSYAVALGGKPCSRIRILVGRGNQNAAVNKEFALTMKAVADRIQPGLIKDIYMGKGIFNQDLLPRSLLLECGTYTLEKDRVLNTMPLMAEVITRTLYGGIVGSAGRVVSDASGSAEGKGGVTQGQPDTAPAPASGVEGARQGMVWLIGLLALGLIGFGILSTGSLRGGARKASRNLHEMTGGLLGKKPGDHEDPEHS